MRTGDDFGDTRSIDGGKIEIHTVILHEVVGVKISEVKCVSFT